MLTLDRNSLSRGGSRMRKVCLGMMVALGTIAVLSVTAPRASLAQEAPATTTTAAPAAATAVAPTQKEQQSVFMWFIESSGLIGLIILCLSIYFIATVSRLFLEMRPIIAMPPEIIARCEALLEQRDFKSIFGVVKEDNSFFSKALETGISELPNGLAEAREAMEKVGESVIAEMDKKISMLAVLGTLGPMIGLLGTLKGMISSFSAIARGGDSLDPTAVAKGISEALLLTFEGVGLSVPAIYFYAVFRNRVSTISVNTMVHADQFLRHFAHAARSKGAPGPSAQAAAAAKVARP